jgi:chemotaxis protein CheC
MVDLHALQEDALCEILNIAVSHAATALSEMASEPISLSVPRLSLYDRDTARVALDQRTGEAASGVHQSFDGAFKGVSLLVFPEMDSYRLVQRVIGQTVDLSDISELEQDALLEVGNLILTSCLGSIADSFRCQIYNTLPANQQGKASLMIEALGQENGDDSTILLVEVNFRLQQSDIAGYVVLILDMPALEIIRDLLDAYLARIGAGDV